MISTLIRGSTNSKIPIGRNEYLVDTENNSVIYPYTRAENVLGLENIDLPPSSSGGSSLLGDCVSKIFPLGPRNIPVGIDTTLAEVLIEDPGIYLISSHVMFGKYRTVCTGDMLTFIFYMTDFTTTRYGTRSQSAYHGYLEDAVSGIYEITEPTTIAFRLYTPGNVKPGIQVPDDGGTSRINVKYIKLSTIHETES